MRARPLAILRKRATMLKRQPLYVWEKTSYLFSYAPQTCNHIFLSVTFSPSETRDAGLVFLDPTGGGGTGEDVIARSTFNHVTATAASPVIFFLERVLLKKYKRIKTLFRH